MKAISKSLILIVGTALALSQSLYGVINPKVLKQRMVSDLEMIKGYLEVKYAPIEWKKEFVNLDLDAEMTSAHTKINGLASPTVKDFQRILKEFLQAVKDYHVNVHYYSTEYSLLPFTVKGAEGRFFISYIDRAKAPSYSFPFEVGDEILTFGSEPIGKVIEQVREQELGSNTKETDQSLAELLLTVRRGEIGNIVPKGPVKLTIKRKSDGKVKDALVHWIYSGEKIKDIGLLKGSALSPEIEGAIDFESDLPALLQKTHFFEKMMVNSSFGTDYLKNFNGENPHMISSRNSFLPLLGRVVWQTTQDCHFNAYIFDGPHGKKIGYVRIPHYMCGAPEASEFLEIINNMQRRTDALVIDQLNNSGGSVFYTYALAAMLTNKPLDTPKHKIALTQQEMHMAVTLLPLLDMIQSDADAKTVLGQTIGGYPVSMETIKNMRRFFQFIINEWNEGRFLTRPVFTFGVDQIKPHPKGQYTKPIVLLINELDFSCADFFPSILKDNNRAVVLGTRTAGAGGYVLNVTFPNSMGIESISLTGSIAERFDRRYIENNGIEPDISYSPTANDLENNYAGFAQKILETVESLIVKK